ncbi:MAG: hypothetical protein KJP19_02245 [Deltaproteobacteria bacterium]|nr:hypothetical protein [Deltaproteobacteria bacterium]
MIPFLWHLDVFAQEGESDLRAAVQNPISSLISLPFTFAFDFGADNGDAQFVNIQPVVSVSEMINNGGNL